MWWFVLGSALGRLNNVPDVLYCMSEGKSAPPWGKPMKGWHPYTHGNDLHPWVCRCGCCVGRGAGWAPDTRGLTPGIPYVVDMESDPPPCDVQKEQPQCDECTSFQVSAVYCTDPHFVGMDPPLREVQKEQHDKGMPFQV